MAGFRRPFELDYALLARTHAPPPEYFETDWLMPPEEIEARQLERLQARARRAHDVPFFRRRWDDAGFDPAELRSLADLGRAGDQRRPPGLDRRRPPSTGP